jgi:hypothetical protein
MEHGERQLANSNQYGDAGVDRNYKSQNPNNKQIPMTEIVRASLGLPTLRAGPQFQNFKPVLVIEYWNVRFNCNLVLGIWYLELFDYLTNRRIF